MRWCHPRSKLRRQVEVVPPEIHLFFKNELRMSQPGEPQEFPGSFQSLQNPTFWPGVTQRSDSGGALGCAIFVNAIMGSFKGGLLFGPTSDPDLDLDTDPDPDPDPDSDPDYASAASAAAAASAADPHPDLNSAVLA